MNRRSAILSAIGAFFTYLLGPVLAASPRRNVRLSKVTAEQIAKKLRPEKYQLTYCGTTLVATDQIQWEQVPILDEDGKFIGQRITIVIEER